MSGAKESIRRGNGWRREARIKSAAGPNLGQIRGLAYRDEGRAVMNAAAPLVRDLEAEMPGVAWDLLPMDRVEQAVLSALHA